jgi:hypothetical protein
MWRNVSSFRGRRIYCGTNGERRSVPAIQQHGGGHENKSPCSWKAATSTCVQQPFRKTRRVDDVGSQGPHTKGSWVRSKESFAVRRARCARPANGGVSTRFMLVSKKSAKVAPMPMETGFRGQPLRILPLFSRRVNVRRKLSARYGSFAASKESGPCRDCNGSQACGSAVSGFLRSP